MKAESRPICTTAAIARTTHSRETRRRRPNAPSSDAGRVHAIHGIAAKLAPASAASVSEPTMSSLVVRPLCDALERIGLAPVPVLASAGVTLAQLKDPDGQVSCRAYMTMVEWAQRERPQESVPLRLA